MATIRQQRRIGYGGACVRSEFVKKLGQQGEEEKRVQSLGLP
jgi:hypothetical protein